MINTDFFWNCEIQQSVRVWMSGGGITCDHRGVRELTDFGNLSTVNQKPVTFVIGTNNMPHEGEYITSYNCYKMRDLLYMQCIIRHISINSQLLLYNIGVVLVF